jgi:hypothetical protein
MLFPGYPRNFLLFCKDLFSKWGLFQHFLNNNMNHKGQNLSLSYVTTDGQTASLSWNKAPMWGAYDQNFITVRQLRVCWCEALSLTRGRVCRLQFLLVLASAVIFHDHILLFQIRDFLLIASYDLQGFGGGIRPRLHTGNKGQTKILWSMYCYWECDFTVYVATMWFLPDRQPSMF